MFLCRRYITVVAGFLILAAVMPQWRPACAQPVLVIRDVSLSWPTVTVRVRVECNGEFRFDTEKRQFRLRENGRDIPNYALSCDDSANFCPMSVALVFDASSSMGTGVGSPLEQAKAAGRIFVNTMHTDIDEAAIVYFTTTARVAQTVTDDKMRLLSGIGNIAGGGGTAVWDAAIAGIAQVSRFARNPCRAVVLLTDGRDNASRSNPQDVVDSAVAHGIRVFTIGLGTDIDSLTLRSISSLTGGRMYLVPSASELASIYRTISRDIMYGHADCELSYTGACTTDSSRTLDITLHGVCDGETSARVSFTTPPGGGTIRILHAGTGSTSGPEQSDIRLPILLHDTLANDSFPPLDITLMYDTALLRLLSVETPAGTCFAGKHIAVSGVPGGTLLRMPDSIIVAGSGTAAYLVFRPADVFDTVCTDIDITGWSFDEGCLEAVTSSGRVCITPCDMPPPEIDALNATTLCTGDSCRLDAGSGYAEYRWYRDGRMTGDSTRTLTANLPGSYSVRVFDAAGCHADSPPVTVDFRPRREFSFGEARTIPVRAGREFTLPISCNPDDSLDDPVGFDAAVRFDGRLFTYRGIDAISGPHEILWLRETLLRDEIRISCVVQLTASADPVFGLRFIPQDAPAAAAPAMMSVSEASFHSSCDRLSVLHQPVVILDGACEKLLVRHPVPSLAISPNPAVPCGASDISFHIDMPVQAEASMLLVAHAGVIIPVAAARSWPAGRHLVRFDSHGLPAGAYLLVLISQGATVSKPFLILK